MYFKYLKCYYAIINAFHKTFWPHKHLYEAQNVQISYIFAHNPHRGVEQLVARRAHNPKVVGSSPASATQKRLVYPAFFMRNLVQSLSYSTYAVKYKCSKTNTDKLHIITQIVTRNRPFWVLSYCKQGNWLLTNTCG